MKDYLEFAPEGVHQKVLELLTGMPPGWLLDAPAGQGRLSFLLEERGFKTFLGDLQRENLLFRNGRALQMDLNDPLPFKNESFDYIASLEGIEHLENPHHLIKEFSRILKKNGIVILSTPNVMTIKSRWRFFFYSYLDFFRYFGPVPSTERHYIDSYDHQHINPLFYGELKWIIKKGGLRIIKIETNRLVRKGRVLHPFIKWVVKYKTKRKYPDDPVYVSDVLLEGENLILIAQKAGIDSK